VALWLRASSFPHAHAHAHTIRIHSSADAPHGGAEALHCALSAPHLSPHASICVLVLHIGALLIRGGTHMSILEGIQLV